MSSKRARSSPSVRILVCVFLPLVGVALLVSGLVGVVSFGVLPLVEALRMRSWIPVPAMVEEVGLRVPDWPIRGPLELLDIRYRYEHAGTTHEGRRYDSHDGLIPAKAGRLALAELKATPAITVWVHPRAPAEAIVSRGVRWQILALALPALSLAVAGGAMVYWGMAAWRRDEAGPAVGPGQA